MFAGVCAFAYVLFLYRVIQYYFNKITVCSPDMVINTLAGVIFSKIKS